VFIDEEEQQEPDFATPVKRVFVVLIDIINCWILSYAASFIFTNSYERPLYISCIGLLLIYKIIAEKTGWQSFGKMMYKIEVCSADGSKPGWSQIFRRNIIWLSLLVGYAVYFYVLIPRFGVAATELPMVFSFVNIRDVFKVGLLFIAVDMAFVFFTPKRQALHDMLAETIVIDQN